MAIKKIPHFFIQHRETTDHNTGKTKPRPQAGFFDFYPLFMPGGTLSMFRVSMVIRNLLYPQISD